MGALSYDVITNPTYPPRGGCYYTILTALTPVTGGFDPEHVFNYKWTITSINFIKTSITVSASILKQAVKLDCLVKSSNQGHHFSKSTTKRANQVGVSAEHI